MNTKQNSVYYRINRINDALQKSDKKDKILHIRTSIAKLHIKPQDRFQLLHSYSLDHFAKDILPTVQFQ